MSLYSRTAPGLFIVFLVLGILSFSSSVFSMSTRPASESSEEAHIILTKLRFVDTPVGLKASLSVLSDQEREVFKGMIPGDSVIPIHPPVALDISTPVATRFPLSLPGALVTPYLKLSDKNYTCGGSYLLTVSLKGYPFGPGQVPTLTLLPDLD